MAISPKDMLASRFCLMGAGLLSSGMAIGISFGLATLFVKNNLVRARVRLRVSVSVSIRVS